MERYAGFDGHAEAGFEGGYLYFDFDATVPGLKEQLADIVEAIVNLGKILGKEGDLAIGFLQHSTRRETEPVRASELARGAAR